MPIPLAAILRALPPEERARIEARAAELSEEYREAHAELDQATPPIETLIVFARMNPPPQRWFDEPDDILPDDD